MWAELIATTLADAGVTTCVSSPGSRSTPLVAALAAEPRLELITIIDERAAAFFALGAARATGKPTAVVCTSGTAAAHYLPALVEASMAGVPLLAITADRPPELQACGASQTIDQVGMYGHFVRGAFDLGAPAGQALALRSVRRKLVQAITLASGPHPGPVHVEVPLRKPLEPALAQTDEERAFAAAGHALRGPVRIAAPMLAPDLAALEVLAAAITDEPRGVILAGALPVGFARDAVFALAQRASYPVIAEAGSQLRFGPRPDGVVMLDHADLVPLAQRPLPRLIVQLGAEPVAASWPGWRAATRAKRYVLAGATWSDADNAAALVVLGDVATALAGTTAQVRDRAAEAAWLAAWRDAESRATTATEHALAQHPRNEAAVVRAAVDAVPAGGAIQIGNSLPIRVIDQVCTGSARRTVLTQRGAAGIDGLIASAAGATQAGQPVLLLLGDVSFAHDVGGLLAARRATAPLAVVVLDNRGGQIFSGLPVARAHLGAAFERHFSTAPELDPSAVATAFGARALTAASPAAVGSAVASALATPGLTVIHAPVSASGAHDVRRTAIELYGGTHEQAEQAR
ncbi:MAG: 2-succinyl-5-enolpyruvyl-6-hydroxy-3-cyclohexene-1-carboxylic-acid synthase [Kofleriaceae bacterium]|nr:2-succinyl-5-enolpyruvyl-6-hydroxy-3-cyclohexene-1-carboxylic-acid synthase [Kofleriaceae bacterium]